MKKLFAIVISTVFMLLNFFVQAYATNVHVQTNWLDTAVSTSAKQEEEQLSIEVIQRMSSWQELTKAISTMQKNDNKEDFWCKTLIDSINKNRTTTSSDEGSDVICSYNINMNEVNYKQLAEKYKAIINKYNAFNKVQLIGGMKINQYNCNYMCVEVKIADTGDKKYPTTNVENPTNFETTTNFENSKTYWEVSWTDSSGKSWTANGNDSNIPDEFKKYFDMTSNFNDWFNCWDESGTDEWDSFYKMFEEWETKMTTWEQQHVYIGSSSANDGWSYITK